MTSPTEFVAGAIYYVDDNHLRLPGKERETHAERRPVVVISDQGATNGTNAQSSQDWPSVLVVPISSSTTKRTRFCVQIRAGEGNLKKKGWARVPATQIIDKDWLSDLLGFIDGDTLDEITGQLLGYLGILPPESDDADEEESDEESD